MPPQLTPQAPRTHSGDIERRCHIQHTTECLTINVQIDAQPTERLHSLPHSSSKNTHSQWT